MPIPLSEIRKFKITAGLLLLSVYYLKSVLPFYVESNNTEQHLDATKTAADCSPVIW